MPLGRCFHVGGCSSEGPITYFQSSTRASASFQSAAQHCNLEFRHRYLPVMSPCPCAQGVVYITDETSRHEITSWRMADALEAPPPAPLGQGLAAAHVVVIVDHSGSMRKGDVPGYDSRTAAVYDCLAKDLVEPQLKNGGGAGMQVSAIAHVHSASPYSQPLHRH